MKNNPRPVTVGSVWESKSFGKFEVVTVNSFKDVTVKFIDTGFETKCQAGAVRSGSVKDLNMPSRYGVGFIGKGNHKSRGIAYIVWNGMLARCYDKKTQKKRPTYIGCTVCEDWHNFQNFAEWYHSNVPDLSKTYHVDKDLKHPGNKHYSPENCIFVDPLVNSFMTDSLASRGDLLLGCTEEKRMGRGTRNIRSRCCNPITGKREHLGYYSNDTDGHLAWRKRKFEIAVLLANSQERDEVKHALLNWAQALKEFRIHPIDN